MKFLSRSLLLGILIGVGGLLAYEGVMHGTSTDAFCVSCHEMEQPYAALQRTAHAVNARGTSAGCSDCHIPREFGPKILRKIEASREVWGHLTGLIDTPEKYAAHRQHMRDREIGRLRDNDSQECRNCHELERMDFAAQDRAVRRYHRAIDQRGKTCIDCHSGIAHPSQPADGTALAGG
ncbi:MAG: NapC/NirT family cytochrome c [Halieaceae bacterium]